ncbi:MAG: efflux RND transporter periplasmic adaptor subunit [Burkholderiaceae bacterium]
MSNARNTGPALHSRHWYRVRNLRPAWREGLGISRQRLRTGLSHVIAQDGSNRRVRLNESAWAVIGRCDGQTSLEMIWRTLTEARPELLAPQDDWIHLIGKLVDDGFLVCGDWPDLRALAQADDERRRRDRQHRYHPLAPRVSLGSPAALLDRLAGIGELLFSRPGAVLIAGLMLTALLILAGQRNALAVAIGQAGETGAFWWTMLLTFVPVKALHELSHGLAVRRFGGQVHEAGVALLMGMPAPYVDASAADGFASKRERALVSGAGILAELAMAALALIAWSVLAPGLARDICLAVMLIGGVSTVALNGNPLVRLDGYYLFTDLLAMPGLGERSRTLWQTFWRRHLLGMPVPAAEVGHGERALLWSYAPAAWAYRVVLMFWLSGWVGGISRVAGLTIAIAALIWLLVMPIANLLRAPSTTGQTLRLRLRAGLRLTAGATLTALLLAAPVPDRVWAPGMIWWPDAGRVRIEDAGFVQQVIVDEGSSVVVGQPLLTLVDPDLDTEIRRWRAVLDGRAGTWFANLEERGQGTAGAEQHLRQAEQELAHLIARRERLVVRAPAEGRVRYTAASRDLVGRFLHTGDMIAVVDSEAHETVQALIDQPTLARLRGRPDARTAVAVATHDGRLLKSRLRPATPAAVRVLPDAGFARALGGAIDAERDAGHSDWRPRAPVYPLTVHLDEPVGTAAGSRVQVRLDLGSRPLLAQWIDRLWQALDPKLAPEWS